MIREIKFRAWNYVQKVMLGTISIEHLLTEPPLSKNGVDELIIMQYTGLKDEDGVEIYEGDIISWYGRNLLILWEESDASFFAISGDESIMESGQEWANNCKVVGNIYQNRELMNDI
jgi:hypothetical protein